MEGGRDGDRKTKQLAIAIAIAIAITITITITNHITLQITQPPQRGATIAAPPATPSPLADAMSPRSRQRPPPPHNHQITQPPTSPYLNASGGNFRVRGQLPRPRIRQLLKLMAQVIMRRCNALLKSGPRALPESASA